MNIYVGTYLKIYHKKVVKSSVYILECKECNNVFRRSKIDTDMKYCGSCGKKHEITEIPRERYEVDHLDIFGQNCELSTIGISTPYIYFGASEDSDSEACLFRSNTEYIDELVEINGGDIFSTKQNFEEYFAKEIKFLTDNERDFEILTGVLTI